MLQPSKRVIRLKKVTTSVEFSHVQIKHYGHSQSFLSTDTCEHFYQNELLVTPTKTIRNKKRHRQHS